MLNFEIQLEKRKHRANKQTKHRNSISFDFLKEMTAFASLLYPSVVDGLSDNDLMLLVTVVTYCRWALRMFSLYLLL
jgi:hypothetical protein